MNLIILYQRRSRTALLGVALTALLLITHLQNNSPIRYRTLALFFAKAQQAEASRNAHQAAQVPSAADLFDVPNLRMYC